MLSLYFTTYTSLGLFRVLGVWTSGNPLWADCLRVNWPPYCLLKASGQSCRHLSSAQLLLSQPQWEMEGFCCIRSFNNRVFTLAQSVSLVMETRESIMWCFSAPYKFYISACMCLIIFFFLSSCIFRLMIGSGVLNFSLGIFSQQIIFLLFSSKEMIYLNCFKGF